MSVHIYCDECAVGIEVDLINQDDEFSVVCACLKRYTVNLLVRVT